MNTKEKQSCQTRAATTSGYPSEKRTENHFINGFVRPRSAPGGVPSSVPFAGGVPGVLLLLCLWLMPAVLAANAASPGAVVGWGSNKDGQTTVPTGLNGVTAIAAGAYHTVALKDDGTIVAWGYNHDGQTTIPSGVSGVTAIAAGGSHTVVLKGDGTVMAWGRNVDGQTTVPGGLSGVAAIAAGFAHTVVLKSNGTVVAWGSNDDGQTTVPAGLGGVVAISAGGFHTVALKNNGTVVAWGLNEDGQSTVPPGLSGVSAIAAGAFHTVILRSDATVQAWGYNYDGQTTVPAGLNEVAAIAAGGFHTVVLKSDGLVVGWGLNDSGQTTDGMNGVRAVSAGIYHTVSLVGTVMEATELFHQLFEIYADAITVALTEAGIKALDGLAVDVDQELEEARVLADVLAADSNDPQVPAIYAKKAKQIQRAATKLLAAIHTTQNAVITKIDGQETRFSNGRTKAQTLILKLIRLAKTTNKTLFTALPKTTPGTGGGTHCPSFIIEEVKDNAAGFHFAGEIVKFKITTLGNAPWPDDAEVRIIDNARLFGKNSNADDGFSLQPPPKTLTLTMGPDAGSSRVEVRCGSNLAKSRLLYNKGPKPVKHTGGGGGGAYDGTYSGSGQTVSPLGTATSTGRFTVTNGHFTDANGFFTGTVDASGNFTGNWNYSQGSLPIPMSGVFSTTSTFTLSGSIGSTVRGSFTLHKL